MLFVKLLVVSNSNRLFANRTFFCFCTVFVISVAFKFGLHWEGFCTDRAREAGLGSRTAVQFMLLATLVGNRVLCHLTGIPVEEFLLAEGASDKHGDHDLKTKG